MQSLHERCYDAGIKDLEKVDKQTLDQLFNSVEFQQVAKIWAYHEQTAWDYIKLTQAFYLEEWKLLETAKKNLRKKWRQLYGDFIKSRNVF